MQRMQCFIFMGCWVKSQPATVLGRARGLPIRRVQFTGIIFTRTVRRAAHDEDHAARFFFGKIFLPVAAHIA